MLGKKEIFIHEIYWCPVYRRSIQMVMFKKGKWKKFRKQFKKHFGSDPGKEEPAGRVWREDGPNVYMLLRDDVNLGTVVHECTHVCQMIFEDLGLHDDLVEFVPECLKEAQAYYIESLFNQTVYRFKEHIAFGPAYITETKRIK